MKRICRNSDNSSVKVAGPTLILGGGVGGGKTPETFLYHKIKLFARKNSHVRTPTKPMSRYDSHRISS
ncbi:hypothetical protein JWG45_11395 [Leptospira sp. 201903070]|uniref:Uncharacterized protein n=1 Tax=Leptospira ainlahdjerensis TaxID=2810033 RepID=A0ABS2UBL6_9LEPT|nr:hypothetical protein [Leptospira ainlahdjerensis]MBM9577664.1 hypothetical protein [Leptospira ainlahdjerensis]MBM9577756.1 hypothetical protein [Leptospira ainlahdjerensis]